MNKGISNGHDLHLHHLGHLLLLIISSSITITITIIIILIISSSSINFKIFLVKILQKVITIRQKKMEIYSAYTTLL